VVEGALPEGLALDSSSGLLTGIPSVPGPFQFSVQVNDSAGAISLKKFSFSVDASTNSVLNLNSIPDAAAPAQQLTLDLISNGSYPLAIRGTASLRFVADAVVAGDDPAIQFSTGGRSVGFTLAANSTRMNPPLALQTGTVAGTIELTFKMDGLPDLTRSIKIARSAPSVRDLKLTRNSAGFELRATGFSTSREVTQATVRFAGTGLQTTEVVVPLSDLSRNWYQSAGSAAFGSQFSLVLPFAVQGDLNTIQSVSLTIINSQGASNPSNSSF